MDGPKHYRHYARIGFILIVSGGFLWVSLYAKAWTEHNVFPILFPAVALSAWIGGRLGGLLSTLCLALGTAYFHLSPEGFAIDDPADAIRLGTFTFSGAVVAWLSGALKESQTIMMATLRSIGDAVIATDRHGSVRFLNPLAEMLTGWSQKDAKGRPLVEVFRSTHSETGVSVQIPAPDAMCGVVSLPENIYLVSKSGSHIPIEDSFAPVLVESGRILGSILVFRDATRRKQNEATLMESERQRLQAQRMEAVGRLAGGVAHDFNNLLTIINGYADLALRRIGYDTQDRKGIEEIRHAGERAANLTRQLLVFSRGQPAKLEVVDLSQILVNFEKMLRRLIGEDIELVTIPANEPLPVRVDVGQIEQVIMNLAANARDAMPGGGRLTLETCVRRPDETVPGADLGAAYAVLTVTDTGVGIDRAAKAHLFEPFFTTKEPGKGTGLGLSIIYGIVKSHQGHLRVESVLGQGSTFEVYLPCVEILQEENRTTASPKESPRGTATILLVEDNRDVRILMRDVLDGLGYVVLEAGCAEDAVQAVQNYAGPIELMVSDIVMPRLGGFELAKLLAPVRPGMRVLYVSGYADHETVKRVQADPTTAYLPKPFSASDLASKVAEMIARSKESGAG
jgi:two-component system cell cycle sensor histidine kinase/response regulator CckA